MQLILKNIRALRIKRGDNLLDMAEKLKMSIPRLSAIENNKIQMPDDFLKNLFTAYGLASKERSDFVTKRLKIAKEDIKSYMGRKKIKGSGLDGTTY